MISSRKGYKIILNIVAINIVFVPRKNKIKAIIKEEGMMYD